MQLDEACKRLACVAGRTKGPHENAKPAFSKFSGLKSVFEKFCFRDRLVWTVGLTVEIKLRFRDGLVWTVGLTEEIKLCFRDGVVWTVGLTVEIKLHFQFSPCVTGPNLTRRKRCNDIYSRVLQQEFLYHLL